MQLLFSEGAWAWGPGIHTVISCRLLGDAFQILPFIGHIIQAYPAEFLYGNLAADFLVGKGSKKRNGHSHNWDTGFRLLEKASDESEVSYAYGFMSHLAADIVAHNYFVPNLIHNVSTWRRLGHIYWEIRADQFVGSDYLKMANEVLGQDRLDLDKLLKQVMGRKGNGLRTRKRLYTGSLRFSDADRFFNPLNLMIKNSRYQIPSSYLSYMIELSFRAAKDLLTRPDHSPIFAYDPVGSQNLSRACRYAVLSKVLRLPRHARQFQISDELLRI